MFRRWSIAVLVAVCTAALMACRMGTKPSSASTDRVTAATGFVQSLAKGAFSEAAAMFDDTMRQALPAAQLQQVWQDVIGQQGAFRGITGTHVSRQGDSDIVDLTSEFGKSKLDIRVVFDRSGSISGLWFLPPSSEAAPEAQSKPPAYANKERFDEWNVFINEDGDWELPGTLTVPKGQGPFPAVVLVHGSGPNDRDETLGPNKPFRDIAWGLASKGIAVLRYDKRTKVHAAKVVAMADKFTVKEEVVDDALAAVSMLRKMQRIHPDRIFVLSHSLGGMLIPRIGKADPKIAGLIVMAGPTRSLEDVLVDQISYIASLGGPVTADAEKEIEKVKRQVANVKSPKLSAKTPASSLPLGVPAAYWLDLRGYDPAEAAKSLKQPMLILHGERDYQVTDADLKGWKDALGSRTDVTLKQYPDLNHLLMTGTGRSTPAEYEKPGTVAEVVVDDIEAWVTRQAR